MKRFTDTDKWFDPWFRSLRPTYKCLWLFICDRCDNSGVWKEDMELASMLIKESLTINDITAAFSGRVTALKEGYWLVNRFVEFQYGQLSEKSKPHLQVLSLVEKHRVSKGYPKGIYTLKDKDKDVVINKVNNYGTPELFEKLWKQYPKPVGKKQSLAHFNASVTSEQDVTDIQKALHNYVQSIQGKDIQYIKNGSTWFNNWRDWINYTESKIEKRSIVI
jgi:hypothetical protein